MARRPREEMAGAIHHVYARGNNGAAVFVDDADRQRYVALLNRTAIWHGWEALVYCLMTNHLHLLLRTPRPNLGVGMRRLQGDYGRWFNDRHQRSGHVFQGRYGARRVKTDAQLWVTVLYIENNPVEAGMCERAEDWPWTLADRRRLGAILPELTAA